MLHWTATPGYYRLMNFEKVAFLEAVLDVFECKKWGKRATKRKQRQMALFLAQNAELLRALAGKDVPTYEFVQQGWKDCPSLNKNRVTIDALHDYVIKAKREMIRRIPDHELKAHKSKYSGHFPAIVHTLVVYTPPVVYAGSDYDSD